MLVRRPTSPSSALDKKIADNPPDRYVPLPGSRFGLVSNEYDKNFYAQCSYIAARTLIRCKQVRSKEALARNDGICEMHDKLCSTLKELSNKEKVRLESDFVTKRRRIPMVIRTNDYVCEEDPSLYSVSTCYGSIPNYIAFEDQMLYQLRNANTFTDKELLKMQLEMTKREIATLEEVRSIAKEDARRFYQMFDYSNKTKRKYINLDKLQGRAFEANETYSKSHKEMEELFIKPQVKKPACTNRCIQGTECKTDGETVFVLLQEVVGRIADDGIMAEDDPDRCRSSTVPSSSYCFNHILLDKLQKVYVPCDRCQMPCINLGHEAALCTTHLSVLNNVRRVNLMEAKNAPNSPVFINKVVIDEEERNPHAADQAARLLQKVHENPTAQMTAAAQARSRMQLQQAVAQPRQTLSSTFPHNQQQQQQQQQQHQQQMPPTAMSPAINIHNIPILPRQNSRAKRMANDEASMRCARARPFNRDNFGDKPINTVQPGSSFSSTVQKSSILNATMPIRPPAVYRNVHKPSPTSATSNIQTTPVGGQRVLQRPTHVALPQSDTQQKARHDLIAQSAAALTAQKFKQQQQQQTAPQAQAGSQDDMEFLEEDRKTPPPDDIGMVRQYGRRPSTAGRGQKARGINSGSAVSGSGTTTAGKGRGMPMVHTLQPPGRTIRYMTSKPLGNLTVPVLSSQPQSTAAAASSSAGSSTDQSPQGRRTPQSAAAGKLSGIPPSEVPPSFPPVKPLGIGSLNAPLNPPPDFT
ncbi:hypothetical protein WR25_06025 isoform B [Diploscapter pachys]|uniref:KANL2-like probable zinc-finger domain-containing protein n=1 Tax=Diploscapter pachys TaxID=2018661 RepID=A0A2A2LQC2_9BILA|nr:hypothetical protein WR25_06025 isoform A [Diploscapter pachys]PAV88452.1 hypothetical protein WR25_06025 isoform B [Diploscapter pachys]